MSYIELPNAQLYYEINLPVTAPKQFITLVNGHTRSSSDFRIMTRNLNQDGVAVLTLDNRGSGRSTVTAPFTLSDMCDDVISIWDKEGIKKSHILGISMGGFISQCVYEKASDRIEKMVLISTASNERWINHTDIPWSLEGDAVERKLATYFAPDFVKRNGLLFSTMVKQTKIAIAENNFTERSDLQRAALKAHTKRPDLTQILAPMLVVHGDQDLVIDVGAAREFGQLVPHCTVKILPGVGHLILAEQPRALYEAIKEFLQL